jgi:uncharacterized protein involved in exopolysaccharide biosynthesis
VHMDELPVRMASKQRMPGRTVRDVVMPLFRQRRVVSIVFGGIAIAALLTLALWPRTYEAEMEILVNPGREMSADLSTDAPQVVEFIPSVTQEDVDSEGELLKSRDLLGKVAVACHLEPHDTFPWRRLHTWLRWTGDSTGKQDRFARTVQALSDHLDVAAVRNTTMIRVSYRASDPERAVRVLQTLSELYQRKHTAVRHSTMTLDFLDQQASRFRAELTSAEAHLAEFDARESVVPRQTLRQLDEFEGDLQQELISAYATEKRLAELKALAASLPEDQTTETKEEDNGALLAQMESMLLSLEMKRTEMLARYAPTYRPVQEIQTQIADAQQAITRVRQSPLETSVSDRLPVQDWIAIQSARAEADRAELDAKAAATDRIVKQDQAIARQFGRQAASRDQLVRNVETAQDSYRLYIRQREEERISQALDRARVLNIAIAEPPSLSALPSIHTGWFLLEGLLLAAGAGMATGYIVDLLDPSFRTPDELGQYLGIEVLASVPASTVNS